MVTKFVYLILLFISLISPGFWATHQGLSAYVFGKDSSGQELTLLNEGWQLTGTQLDSIYLEVTGTSPEFLSSPQKMEATARQIANTIEIRSPKVTWKQEKGLYTSLYLSGKTTHGGTSQIIIQSLESVIKDSRKTFIVTNITLNNYEQTVGTYSNLKKMVSPYISSPEAAMVFQGSLRGRVSEQFMKQKINKAFSRLKAKRYPSVSDISFWTITGYSPKLPRYFIIGEDKVNLQWAYHFDKQKGITTVFLGYPLIMSDY